MRWTAAAAIALILAAPPTGAHADEPSRLATAREIMVATHAADNLRSLMPQLVVMLRPLAIQSGQTDQKDLNAFLARGLDVLNETVPDAVEEMARSYAGEMSEQDLDDILAFYRSKAGRDLVEKQPLLTQHLLVVGQRWGQEAGRRVVEEFSKKAAGAPSKM